MAKVPEYNQHEISTKQYKKIKLFPTKKNYIVQYRYNTDKNNALHFQQQLAIKLSTKSAKRFIFNKGANYLQFNS